jgi:hypothetical protein
MKFVNNRWKSSSAIMVMAVGMIAAFGGAGCATTKQNEVSPDQPGRLWRVTSRMK